MIDDRFPIIQVALLIGAVVVLVLAGIGCGVRLLWGWLS